MHFSISPYVLHALPMSFFLICSPEWYSVSSTEHKAPCYVLYHLYKTLFVPGRTAIVVRRVNAQHLELTESTHLSNFCVSLNDNWFWFSCLGLTFCNSSEILYLLAYIRFDMACTPHQIHLGWQNGLDGLCVWHVWGRREMNTGFRWGNLKSITWKKQSWKER